MAIVRYLVHDVDAAIKFYALLGFELEQRWGGPFAILRHDDLRLWLSGPGSSATRPLPDGAQPIAGGWNRIVLEVTNLATVLESLRAVGMHVRSEPISGPGGDQALVDDPAGNPVELFEPKP
jgi:catechol 2,3-dioxygenase-like lactoylglutathione lyase family enzyme